MIKSWTIKNFKSVRELTKLEFAPLTIFAGANSSGKSTIIQSILLTAQTIQNSVTNKSIILNGHISRFGAFNDILSNDANERSISLGFELVPTGDREQADLSMYNRYYYSRVNEHIERIDCEFSFSDHIRGVSSELFQLQPQLEKTYLRVKRRDQHIEETQIVRSSKTIEEKQKEMKLYADEINKAELQTLEFDVKKPSVIHSESIRRNFPSDIPSKYAGAFLNHFLPATLTVLYNKIDEEKSRFITLLSSNETDESSEILYEKYVNEKVIEAIKSIIKEVKEEYTAVTRTVYEKERVELAYVKIMDSFNYINLKTLLKSSPVFLRSYQQKIEDKKSIIKWALRTDLVEENRLAVAYGYYGLYDYSDYIDSYFKRSLKYLGPLRDEPKPVYPLSSSSDPRDIGYKGENTAAVLEVNKNALVKYIHPSHFHDNTTPIVPQEVTLTDAVLTWLDYMGIAKKVDPADKGKLGHELKISTPGSSHLHDLTHVGVGVSQVLPILVLSLLSTSDSVLIFEQPELHLNPKVQTRLADFFFSMTLLSKQCIVETHSEYLINRLRYNVAISDNDNISKNITMYFVEKEGQASRYKQVKINKYGVIEDWPKGFFDENEETAANILRAAMEKRKNEKRN